MRIPFRPVGARYFWLATGLATFATMGVPSASAQQTCELSDAVRKVIGGGVNAAGAAVDAVVSTSDNVIEGTTAVASTADRALQPLTDILGPVADTVSSAAVAGTSTLNAVERVVEQAPGAPVLNQAEGVTGRLGGTVCNTLRALGVQSGIAAVVTTNLTGIILGRLDASRIRGGGSWPTSSGGSTDGMMGLGATEKARPAPPSGAVGPFAVYASGTLLGGNTSDLPGAAGFSYDGRSGLIGLEYSVNRNLILGLAGSFSTIDADVNTGGNVGADVFHGAAYLSYATKAWFVDALAAYGAVDLDLTRPGTSETVRGSTSGGAWAAAARAGYLFDFGKVRAGPLAGLTYVHARVDGYTETGSDPTAMAVGAQTVDSLTGSAGIRFLAPFQAGGSIFVPYLNVTLEHHFGDGNVELTTGLAAPGSPTTSLSFPVFGARDYGKVEGGITIELAPEAAVSLSGASTFARDDGHDYRVSGGVSYRF